MKIDKIEKTYNSLKEKESKKFNKEKAEKLIDFGISQANNFVGNIIDIIIFLSNIEK